MRPQKGYPNVLKIRKIGLQQRKTIFVCEGYVGVAKLMPFEQLPLIQTPHRGFEYLNAIFLAMRPFMGFKKHLHFFFISIHVSVPIEDCFIRIR